MDRETEEMFEQLRAVMERPCYRAPVDTFGTGLMALDLITGGMKPGQVVVVGGTDEEMVRKVITHFAVTALLAERGAVWLSNRQSADEIKMDVVADVLRVPLNVLERGEFDEQVEYLLETMPLLPFLIAVADEPSFDEICGEMGTAKSLIPRIVVVDGMDGLWSGASMGEKLTRLKEFAVECEVPVVVPVRLEQEPETLETFADGVTELADLVIGLEVESCIAMLPVLKGAVREVLGSHIAQEFVWNGFIEDEDAQGRDTRLVSYE